LVLTKKDLFLGLEDQDEIRDHIPLHEVSLVSLKQDRESDNDGAETMKTTHDFKVSGEISQAKGLLKAKTIAAFRFFNGFQIETIQNGFNSGRTYHAQAETKEECNLIFTTLNKYVKLARQADRNATRFERSQKVLLRLYNSFVFQSICALLILTNFALNVYAAQITAISDLSHLHDELSSEFSFIDRLDLFFVFLFTAELLINAYSHWFWEFLKNPWSIFDTLVVSLSLLGLAPIGLPLNLLLLFRCCRVLRIFGKFSAVSNIFSALGTSVIPMASTFFIIFVLSSIYAIVGVTFFNKVAPANFETFSRAFVSMFRITIGSVDWWFETFPAVETDGSIAWRSTTFLITYVIFVNWFFFQVSIAVLLYNFHGASKRMKMNKTMETLRQIQRVKQLTNPLDPLLLRLSKDFTDEADLTRRIR
jgi:voltage-gated sodium channel